MDNTVIVALISFAGTLIGTASGIMASSRLTAYRLEQLEKKVDSQNRLSAKIPVIEEKISNINRRIADLEAETTGIHQSFERCQ